MSKPKRARAVGINHIALEVGDIEEALTFYGRLFDFGLRSKSATMAFIDLGDQFLALQKGRTQAVDEGRHFGLVVDAWGNRIEIIGYENIQFTKAENVLRGMGLTQLTKNKKAIKELTDKGMAPE